MLAGSYTVEDGKVVIDLFGRTLANQSITARIRNFLPYFYIVSPSEDILGELKPDPEVLNLTDVELEVGGEKCQCVKVTIQFPYKVPEYRNRYKNSRIILAADIPFIHRFYYDFNLPSCIRVHGDVIGTKPDHGSLPTSSSELMAAGDGSESASKSEDEPLVTNRFEHSKIENRYTSDLVVDVKRIEPQEPFKPKLKVLSFDIENSVKDSTIYCLCCAYRNPKGELDYKTFDGTEGSIIKGFVEFIHEFDPDVLTGYNIDNYDIPLLIERAAKNNIGTLFVGRDLGKFNKVGKAHFWRLHGRVIADAWWNAKKELRPKKETLANISKLLFNETKDDVDPSKMDEEWANNREKVIKYCSRDAELALRILEKIAILDKSMDLAAVAKLPLDDVINSGTSTLIDSILIREADKNAIGVPCTRRISKTSKIEGGYVHAIKSGLYNWVCLLDFKSMYPSIIIANNICFTTMSGSGTIKSPTGIRFLDSEQRPGILPQILTRFMNDRESAKQKMKAATDPDEKRYYNGLQDAIKILMNSVYGVFASNFYRFTDPKIGASITAFARKNIKDIIKKLEGEDYSVIYSDTDSIFIETGSNDLDNAVKLGETLSKRFTKGGRVLEFEAIFERFFTHGKKKRYVGRKVYPVQETVIRGYETRRTDAFDLQSEVLTKMFDMVLSGKNDEVISYARKTITDVKSGEISTEKLVISKTVKDESQYKDPNRMANVLAMRQLRDMGYDVVPGMKVSYIVTNGHKVPQAVEPFLDGRPLSNQPDLDYYAGRMARTMARITEGMDAETEWDSKALLTGVQQRSLFSESFTQPQPGNEPTLDDADTGTDPDVAINTISDAESLAEDVSAQRAIGAAGKKKGKKKGSKDEGSGGAKLEDFV